MKRATRAVYDEEYAPQPTEVEEEEPQSTPQINKDEDCLGTYLDGDVSDKIEDEFRYFIAGNLISTPQDQVYK